MVRCFIGIFLGEDMRDYVGKIQDDLRKLPVDCKFVESENLHICLSFLGDVDENKIKNISDALDALSKGFSEFEVEISGIKLIPNEKYVRVIVLDVLDKTGNLGLLSKGIVNNIGGDTKLPHVTLCRVRRIENKQKFVEDVKKINIVNKPVQIKSIQLLKSELSRQGPIYSLLHESKLALH